VNRAPRYGLAGARILVTRPAHQANALCRLIDVAGGSALRLPLFTIVPAATGDELRARLEAAQPADWWLFTSANAAHTAATLLPPPWKARVAAVGAATAEALRSGGVAEVLVPSARYSGAALLEQPEFASVRGQRFVIVTGEDGRAELGDGLRARGASVDILALYRRETRTHAPAHVAALVEACHAIVVTSAQGAEHLTGLMPAETRALLLRKQLAVPSSRVAQKVRELGFVAPPLMPDQVSDEAFVRVLADWWQARGTTP
jgi:uroporphyrinogen-III synthase